MGKPIVPCIRYLREKLKKCPGAVAEISSVADNHYASGSSFESARCGYRRSPSGNLQGRNHTGRSQSPDLAFPENHPQDLAGEVNVSQEQYRQSFPDSWEEEEKFFFPQ